MADTSPSELTEQDGAAQILLRGLDDWVSLAEARWLVGRVRPGTAVAVRQSTLDSMAYLLAHRLARLGETVPRFEPWDLTDSEALERVRRDWWDPERELVPGNVCWIDNTPAGDEVARRIEAQRGS